MIIKAKYNVATLPGEYQSIYLETSADQVLFNDGENLQDKLDSGKLSNKLTISPETTVNSFENGAVLYNNNGLVGAKILSASDVNAIPNGMGKGDYLISTDGNITIQADNNNLSSRSDITLKVGDNHFNISHNHIDIPALIQTSDKRLKTNIQEVDDEKYFHLIKKIKISTYNLQDFDKPCLGLMAQDLIGLDGAETIVNYNEEKDLYGINNYSLTSAIASALKHEIKKRQELEEEVKELKRIMGIKKDTL